MPGAIRSESRERVETVERGRGDGGFPRFVETERVTGRVVVFYLDERASNGMIRISTDSESWFDFSLGD